MLWRIPSPMFAAHQLHEVLVRFLPACVSAWSCKVFAKMLCYRTRQLQYLWGYWSSKCCCRSCCVNNLSQRCQLVMHITHLTCRIVPYALHMPWVPFALQHNKLQHVCESTFVYAYYHTPLWRPHYTHCQAVRTLLVQAACCLHLQFCACEPSKPGLGVVDKILMQKVRSYLWKWHGAVRHVPVPFHIPPR